MADFAIWVSAAERKLGFKSGEFIDAYNQNWKEASDVALESSSVATAVYEFMRDQTAWEGTTGELLKSLNARVNKGSRTGNGLPTSAKGLSNALTRLKPKGLRANNVCTSNCHGVEVSSSSHRGIGRAQG